MTVTVYLPVDVVSVRATLGPASALTRLEQLVLRAIAVEEESSLARLATLFALNDRLALDLVWSLWTDGHLLVDLHSGTIRLAPRVTASITDGTLSDLPSSRTKDLTVDLALDPVSGQVITERDTVRRPPTGALVLTRTPSPITITDVEPTDLLRAVLRHEDRPGSNTDDGEVRVLRVNLEHPFRSPRSGGSRFRKIDVRPSVDGDELVAAVDDALAGLTSPQRARIETFLAESIEGDPTGRLVQGLRAAAGKDLAPTPDLADRLRAMRSEIDRTAALGVQAHVIASAHARLAYLVGAVRSELDLRRRSAVATRLLPSTADIRSTALELIHGARRQVVLACPWVRAPAVEFFHEALHEALTRGVHVVLMWGFRAQDRLDDVSANLLISLRDKHPTRLHLSTESSRTHAKLVIADDRHLLISSHNLLSSRGSLVELGLCVDAAPEEQCPPIEAALVWVRRKFPEYAAAQGFLVDHTQFSRRPKPEELSEPELPHPAGDDAQDRAAWRRAWDVRIAELEAEELATRRRVDGIVENQAHRHLLTTAIAQARRRLVVASPQLGAQAMTSGVLAKLEQALTTNPDLVVTVVRATPAKDDAETSQALMDSLVSLAGTFPGRIRLSGIRNWHGKALVWDENVVLSSFNFLSYEGHYVESIRRSRSELGIRVCDPTLSDEVTRAIEQLAGLAADGARPSRVAPESGAAPDMNRGHPDIADAARAILGAAGEAVLDRVRKLDSGRWFALLDELAQMGAPLQVVERVAALTLLEGPDDDARRVGVATALATRAWNSHEFLLAHALLPHAAPAPSRQLRLVAVAVDSDVLGEAVAAAITTGVVPGEATAMALAAAYALLRGQPEAEDAVASLGALPVLRRAALAHWRSEYRGLPWTQLEARASGAAVLEDERRARAEVYKQVGALRTWKSLNFAPGKEFLKFLCRDDSCLGELLAVEGEPHLLDAWLARWGPDATSFIDTHHGLAYREEITGSRRQSLVRKLESLLRSVRTWRDALERAHGAVRVPPAVDVTIRAIHEARTELDAAAREADSWERAVIAAVLSRLDVLR